MYNYVYVNTANSEILTKKRKFYFESPNFLNQEMEKTSLLYVAFLEILTNDF